MLVYFHRFSVFVWTSKKRCEYLRVGRIFYFIFVLKTEKKNLSFQKYPDTVEGARNRIATALLLKKST